MRRRNINEDDPLRLMTGREVQQRLGISLPTLNEFIKQGLPFVVVGTRKRFKQRDLDEFLDSKSQTDTSS